MPCAAPLPVQYETMRTSVENRSGRLRRSQKKKAPFPAPLAKLAEWTGLEPATSGVTGQHSNRLNYHSAFDSWNDQPLRKSCAPHFIKTKAPFPAPLAELAEWTGLEPATSGVTGQHSNRLNYHS